MTRQIKKLKRVMWRLRDLVKKKGENLITRPELRGCIDLECGVCSKTWYNNRTALQRMGWIEMSGYKRRRYKLTGKDLE